MALELAKTLHNYLFDEMSSDVVMEGLAKHFVNDLVGQGNPYR